MYSPVFFTAIFTLTRCISVSRYDNQQYINSKIKVELTPILVQCSLNDIVILSSPIIQTKEQIYHLTNPGGSIRVLQTNESLNKSSRKKNKLKERKRLELKRFRNNFTTRHNTQNVTVKYPYKIINMNDNNDTSTLTYGENFENMLEETMRPNDYVIGPVGEDDHGNWMLSVYFKDIDEDWIELFQFISIEIIESVPSNPLNPKVMEGDELIMSFAYPLKYLNSCELKAPLGTFDRYYEGQNVKIEDDFKNCKYTIKNITRRDHGIWTITGVGKIVYRTNIELRVEDGATKRKKRF